MFKGKDNIDPKKVMKDINISALEQLGRSTVLVGFPESAKNEDGLTIAKYARANNYGVKSLNIPERPFLTKGTFREKYVEKRSNLAKRLVKKVVNKQITAEDALTMLGQEAVNNVRDVIRNGGWRINRPSTIARKLAKSKGKRAKDIKPLIDTGDMISAVTFIVEMPK